MVRTIRIFVSSPGDVDQEREVVKEVIDQINKSEGSQRRLRLEMWDWKENVVPQIGPLPQEVVDEQMPSYDIYLGIMASRFGTPTERYGSGTEQEFRVALGRWSELGQPWIMFYFKENPEIGSDPESHRQYADVLSFRGELEGKGIIGCYRNLRGSGPSFAQKVDLHLRGIVACFPVTPPKPPRPSMLLTSTSPRRVALLEQLGFEEGTDFVTWAGSRPLDTRSLGGHPTTLRWVKQAAMETAERKVRFAVNQGHAVAATNLDPTDSVVVGADTVVFCDGQILDRPLVVLFPGPEDVLAAERAARDMLRHVSGREIHVVTGLAIARADNLSKMRSTSVSTKAVMRSFGDEEVERYVRAARPLDKAGAFAIQEHGVALLERIEGSYTNVVGLPLAEFVDLVEHPTLEGRVEVPMVATAESGAASLGATRLAVVSAGDVNYDFTCNRLPVGTLTATDYPGSSVTGEVVGSPGGNAVYFARAALDAGFDRSSVIGVIGADPLGLIIENELEREGINVVLLRDVGRETGVSIVLGEETKQPRSLTINDAHHPGLPTEIVGAQAEIRSGDVLHLAGDCLVDGNRRPGAQMMAKEAQRAGGLVILDTADDRDPGSGFEVIEAASRDAETGRSLVDLLVADLPEVVRSLGLGSNRGLDDLAWLRDDLLPRLCQTFPAVLLRDLAAGREVMAGPGGIQGPFDLPPLAGPVARADHLAKRLHELLSPRCLLASGSPQRRTLLGQLIAPNQLEVLSVDHEEEERPGEDPRDRVRRLAREKAILARDQDAFGDTIEIIIAADTEIVIEGDAGTMTLAGHPQTIDEAIEVLGRLSGGWHEALTGIAAIGRDPDDESQVKMVDEVVSTRVKFREMDRAEIEQYARTGEPLGRAGGYAIQGTGGRLVERLEGSYSNVVGLPLERLCTLLWREYHVSVWGLDKASNWTLARPLR